ncbi:NAD-dependent malic enzyme [Candidatus Woesearchaeota archaeon CG10_big_fil_rev_8_21_14_0_10_34_8]|nr:MAG: NAD-dependent malic enzyme [Candidatus Woesearchaeota archaeon CG10_big_fil_rev_8_21_14_0_10_34_8]
MKKQALDFHKRLKGKLSIELKEKIRTKEDLSLTYTPGVAEPCKIIAQNKEEVYTYTMKGNTVAVITDGSAVLGLGNIGPEAALPVMEGKCALFKQFAGIDAFPICLDTQDTNEIIETVKRIAPVFGGINLEDISAPRCFEIEQKLQDIGIPVMHDDQHGTAVVVLAGLINACKVTGKNFQDLNIVVNGVGAAGVAITNLLVCTPDQSKPVCVNAPNVLLCDSKGIIYNGRDNLNSVKKELAKITNGRKIKGSLADALKGADVFIGVSQPNLLTKEMIKSMNKDPIIFAMANPVPEIMPDKAKAAGAAVVATGRSDFPNQVNNAVAFPGIFKGALESRSPRITEAMKIAAAEALAALVKNPNSEKIIPAVLDKGVSEAVAKAVKGVA